MVSSFFAAVDATSTREPPRLLLYSHSNYGLGHIHPLLRISAALQRRRPETLTLLVSPFPQVAAFDLPPNFDFIRLPSLSERGPVRPLPGMHAPMLRLRERLILESAMAFEPHLFLVDFLPGGVDGELLPTLEWLRSSRPHTKRIFTTLDILDEPQRAHAWCQRVGMYDLLEREYDRVLVRGSREIYDFVAEYGFSATVGAKIEYCGYVVPDTPPTPARQIRRELGAENRPLIVVTAGGGLDGAAILRAYLRALRDGRLGEVASFVTVGMSMPPEQADDITEAAANMPGVTLVQQTKDLPSYLNAADLVVCMGGTTSCEAAALRKRVIVVPRAEPPLEQLERARRLAGVGLVQMLHPRDLSPKRLAAMIQQALASPPPTSTLDGDGVRRVADALEQALDSAGS